MAVLLAMVSMEGLTMASMALERSRFRPMEQAILTEDTVRKLVEKG